MTKLGFEAEDLVGFKAEISKPYGMILVCGPRVLKDNHTVLYIE